MEAKDEFAPGCIPTAHRLATQDRLDRLRRHFPVAVEVCSDGDLVELQLAQPLQN